jgi:hypothetical protein
MDNDQPDKTKCKDCRDNCKKHGGSGCDDPECPCKPKTLLSSKTGVDQTVELKVRVRAEKLERICRTVHDLHKLGLVPPDSPCPRKMRILNLVLTEQDTLDMLTTIEFLQLICAFVSLKKSWGKSQDKTTPESDSTSSTKDEPPSKE